MSRLRHTNHRWSKSIPRRNCATRRTSMRFFFVAMFGLLLGCGAEDAPRQLEPAHREAMRRICFAWALR